MGNAHFDLPPRWDRHGHLVTLDQDTEKDVLNCVEAILRTVIGQRDQAPDFGRPDLTFQVQPLDLNQLTDVILEQEPRAFTVLDQHPGILDQMIVNIRAEVSSVGGSQLG
jgi:hypothetical protein